MKIRRFLKNIRVIALEDFLYSKTRSLIKIEIFQSL